MSVLDKYEGKRRIYPTVKRPGNPPLNTRYIRRKWLDVPYAEGCPRALMDIYLPNDGDGPFPVILFAHGGGYFTGDKGDYETYPPLEGLKRGYAVCAINYTLSGEALFPRQIQEGKAALRFIRANAAQYNLDTVLHHRLGHERRRQPRRDARHDRPQALPRARRPLDGQPRPAAPRRRLHDLVLPDEPAPLADFAARRCRASGTSTRGPDAVMTWYFGMDLDDVPSELLRLANPETYVSPATPPFVIQHGKPDRIVPYVQSVRLAEKLKAAIGEDKVRLTIFDDYVHADRRFETMHNCSIVLDQLEELLGRGTMTVAGERRQRRTRSTIMKGRERSTMMSVATATTTISGDPAGWKGHLPALGAERQVGHGPQHDRGLRGLAAGERRRDDQGRPGHLVRDHRPDPGRVLHLRVRRGRRAGAGSLQRAHRAGRRALRQLAARARRRRRPSTR